MDNKEFKEKVYEPYAECWQILRVIQNSSCKDEKAWKEWEKLTDEFDKKHDDPIGHALSKMLYSLGDEIGKINGKVIR